MNEQFRVAQKIGLMFRPEEPLPKDINAWTIKQLHAPSPAIGIETLESEPKPWPKPILFDHSSLSFNRWAFVDFFQYDFD